MPPVGAIAVAPSDPNVIYVGTRESPIRGVTTPHGDHHDHWINPGDRRNMINGNDGGATASIAARVSMETRIAAIRPRRPA